MKTVYDYDAFARIVEAVIQKCRDDIVSYRLGHEDKQSHDEALSFIKGKNLDYYLQILGFQKDMYSKYRDLFFVSCDKEYERQLRLVERRQNVIKQT